MSAEFEAQILADLRRTHAQLKKTPPSSTPAQGNGVHGWSMRLTIEEVDLLLKIVDERDDLRRRLLSDWEPDIYDAGKIEQADLRPHLDALNDAAATLAKEQARPSMVTAAPASCPFADTVHDCPRGGCPDASPREVQIPDLPMDVVRDLPGEAVAALVGREARETPPNDYPERNCRWCGTRIKPTPVPGVFEHVASASVVGFHPAEPVPGLA